MIRLKLKMLIAMGVAAMVSPSITNAQVVYSYQLVPQTVYEKKPVTVSRWVDETVMDKQQVTSYKPVWEKETRERRQVSYKPVQKTSEREQRVVTYKPIVETLYRENRIEETTFETVTEYRDEQYIVRKPVIETQMREETYTVRKPVTENLIEVNRVTTYKPVLKPETTLVPMQTQMDMMLAVPDNNQRPRLRRLEAGYYTDPATGLAVYRNRGLHWVQPTVALPAASTVPTLVPQQTNRVEYVPETVETRKPVEVTRYVDSVVTQKVPVEVQRMVEQVETRKVPVTVRKPTTRVVVEKVPYTKTTYQEEVVVKKVPFVETTYQKVETVEPYEVEVLKWIPETREVETPRTVRRRVEYQMMQDVPRTVMMKVPVDVCGNPLGNPVPVYNSPPLVQSPPVVQSPVMSSLQLGNSSELSSGFGTTLTRRVDPGLGGSVSEIAPVTRYQGTLELVRPKSLEETSGRSNSVLVPETPASATPQTELGKLDRPEDETGHQKTLDETSGRTEKENAENQSQVDPNEGSDPAQPTNDDSGAGNESTESRDVVPAVTMPEVEPSRTGDENAAERTPDLNAPG